MIFNLKDGMGNKEKLHRFSPDYCSPPGDSLKEMIEAIGMKRLDFSRYAGLALKTINEIVEGKQAITPEIAIHLEKALGAPASYWNNLEKNYREFLARERRMKS